jgi:Raf kinase inhibitor-like YbhB/YbcL family protein
MILHSQRARPTHQLAVALAVVAAFVSVLAASAVIMQPPPQSTKQMQVTSAAFKNNESIPAQYTCEGKNISPPLAWTGAPAGTRSFVLIVDDPDAPHGVWTHWVVFDLPADTTELAEDTPKSQSITGNAKQGTNDFKQVGYGGPCPPAGKPHRYFFKLYALDTLLDLKPGASKNQVEAALAQHVLAQGQLVGTYQRK